MFRPKKKKKNIYIYIYIYIYIRVSANMPKECWVGRSENLFKFYLIVICYKKIKNVYWG